ncbi:MAG: hypothetical protein CVU38_08345 [Chloroflexi bacterium HGW-Chloroflexi-1]|nr:MAG: hypothetical protein CVU38_08345 [Chloroflexi bacterium HGW-Chloroflexi-1]
MSEIDAFIHDVTRWAATQPDIRAVALVGSHARGAATETSDIDLVLLADSPEQYLTHTGWVARFGAVVKQETEDYGKVTSLRVWYANGREVEYGLTTPDWALPPLDEGTRRVIRDGMQVLFEREALLSRCLGG